MSHFGLCFIWERPERCKTHALYAEGLRSHISRGKVGVVNSGELMPVSLDNTEVVVAAVVNFPNRDSRRLMQMKTTQIKYKNI